MDNRVIISLIDLGLESFWKEPTTAKIEGNFGRELVAKSYLKEKGLTSEDIETNIDKIKFKLASLEDKDKNVQQPMPPPGSVDGKSTSDFSYQGPNGNFHRALIWIENWHERIGVGCSFHDEEEHIISQGTINDLQAPVVEGIALLRWSPDNKNMDYLTAFQVVPNKYAPSNIVLGKQWWEDPKEEIKGKFDKERNRMSSDTQSVVSSASTNKSRISNARRKYSENKQDQVLERLAKVMYKVIKDGSVGSEDEEVG